MSNLKKDIHRFIVDNFLFGEAGNLSEESSLLEQSIIDSTGVLELVAHLESTYQIKVNDEEILPENLDSINAITAYLGRKLATV